MPVATYTRHYKNFYDDFTTSTEWLKKRRQTAVQRTLTGACSPFQQRMRGLSLARIGERKKQDSPGSKTGVEMGFGSG